VFDQTDLITDMQARRGHGRCLSITSPEEQ
jgi:hypothetical protein